MSAIGIIIGREFRERVMKKSFIISTILTPLLMVGIMVGTSFIMATNVGEAKHIAVVDRSGVIAPSLASTEVIVYEPTDRTPEELRAEGDEQMYGFLVIGEDIVENPSNVSLYSYSTSTMEVESAIARDIEEVIEQHRLKAYDIENLPQIMDEVEADVTLRSYKLGEEDEEDKESSSVLAFGLSYIFGFVMYIFVIIYGSMVMQGVIEEKSGKVLEVMVATVRPYQLMMGKILGIASVAVLQFVIWIVIIFVGGTVVMQFMMPSELVESAAAISAGTADMAAMEGAGVDPEMAAMLANATDIGFLVRFFGSFLLYFLGGYLLYAAMFAAVGSAVDNVQDAQQFQTPITMPIIIGFIVMMFAMKEPHAPLSVWCSMIPFTSPIVMMARLPFDVPMWELALSLVILAASFAVMVWIAAKIYRIGIFMHGRKPSYKELWQWIRMKD
ncbi:MAG: ABC transporter permease [Rikenellaceae bacterium]|nr:ABC transporter permease [Rikenellaceae bacterium]